MRPAALLVCVLALAGCGEAASTSAGEFEGEERAVAEVIDDLQAAAERGEGDRICKEILATELVEDLEAGDVECSTELEKALREADDKTLAVTAVEVTGDTATASVEGREGNEERTATFGLAKERGAWRVTSLR